MPDKTEKKQGKFSRGRSGNPLGRPRGIRNKATIAAEALFEGEIEGICRKAIEEAKRRNIQAIKLVLDRILPPKKEAPIFINLPPVKTGSDILEAIHPFDEVETQSFRADNYPQNFNLICFLISRKKGDQKCAHNKIRGVFGSVTLFL